MPDLHWKRKKVPAGFAQLGSAAGTIPVGSELTDGQVVYAWTVFKRESLQWFWVVPAGLFGDMKSTTDFPVADEELAKAQALAWVCNELTEK